MWLPACFDAGWPQALILHLYFAVSHPMCPTNVSPQVWPVAVCESLCPRAFDVPWTKVGLVCDDCDGSCSLCHRKFPPNKFEVACKPTLLGAPFRQFGTWNSRPLFSQNACMVLRTPPAFFSSPAWISWVHSHWAIQSPWLAGRYIQEKVNPVLEALIKANYNIEQILDILGHIPHDIFTCSLVSFNSNMFFDSNAPGISGSCYSRPPRATRWSVLFYAQAMTGMTGMMDLRHVVTHFC
jgi:hypothetical protein